MGRGEMNKQHKDVILKMSQSAETQNTDHTRIRIRTAKVKTQTEFKKCANTNKHAGSSVSSIGGIGVQVPSEETETRLIRFGSTEVMTREQSAYLSVCLSEICLPKPENSTRIDRLLGSLFDSSASSKPQFKDITIIYKGQHINEAVSSKAMKMNGDGQRVSITATNTKEERQDERHFTLLVFSPHYICIV